ncbi:MAG: cytochrome-c peroxidase [Bdellovibrionales bacterium CG10_big_fil_rev_8_21_14_0_10_45_34]|nr:MAG: cytochrome-c peroxidase [Bdellovibrionales bacterium CG10_big_fil_rev_8_21_14_0_10_45_34]
MKLQQIKKCRIVVTSVALLSLSQTLAAGQSPYEIVRSKFRKWNVESLAFRKPPAENKSQIELGRLLFFDKILSGNKNISCATCHHPSLGSVDALPVSIGSGGQGLGPSRYIGSAHFIPRNAPAIFNIGYIDFHTTMWDGRIAKDPVTGHLKTPESAINGASPVAAALASQLTTVAAAQAMFPGTSHEEMLGFRGENEVADSKNNLEIWQRLTERIVGKDNGQHGGIEAYRLLLRRAYPEVESFDDFNFAHLARSIAAFESHAFRANLTAFDYFMIGDDRSLSNQQLSGASIFVGKARCVECHSGSHFTDFQFYSLGSPQLGPGKGTGSGEPSKEDRGLALITNNPQDNYRFKTPTLRNVILTGPWLHSGVYSDLSDVIEHHSRPMEMCQSYSENPPNFLSVFRTSFLVLLDSDTDRNQRRMHSVDARLNVPVLSKDEKANLIHFLSSLTDTSYLNRAAPPRSVPSGLPVED